MHHFYARVPKSMGSPILPDTGMSKILMTVPTTRSCLQKKTLTEEIVSMIHNVVIHACGVYVFKNKDFSILLMSQLHCLQCRNLVCELFTKKLQQNQVPPIKIHHIQYSIGIDEKCTNL